MTSFCTDTLHTQAHLRSVNGIVRADAFAISADARKAADLLMASTRASLAEEQQRAKAALDEEARQLREQLQQESETAQQQAAQALAKAQEEAQSMLDKAHAEAQQLSIQEQERVATQSAALLTGLNDISNSIVTRIDGLVIDLTQTLFDRLMNEATPKERIAAALDRVILEAPPKLVDSLLRVHPDDVAHLPELDWPIKADPSIRRGACRLEAHSGQWSAGFDGAAEAITNAFKQAARPPAATEE